MERKKSETDLPLTEGASIPNMQRMIDEPDDNRGAMIPPLEPCPTTPSQSTPESEEPEQK